MLRPTMKPSLFLLLLVFAFSNSFAQTSSGSRTVLRDSGGQGTPGAVSGSVAPSPGHAGRTGTLVLHSSSQKPKTRAGITRSDRSIVPSGVTERAGEFAKVQYILQFSGADDATKKARLAAELASFGNLTIASPEEFKNKSSRCRVGTCVLASPQQLQAIKSHLGALSKDFSFKELGAILHQKFVDPGAIQSSGLKDRRGSHSAAKTTSGAASHWGNTLFSYTSPYPGYDWIPDNDSVTGWKIGNFFSPSVAATQSGSVEVSSTTYTVGFYHPYPNDLTIDIEYNNSAMGGSTWLISTSSITVAAPRASRIPTIRHPAIMC